MEHGVCEVAVGHLQAIVEDPETSTEALRDTGEATAGRRVGLEHDEGEVGLLREHCGVEVVLHHRNGHVVAEEAGEVELGILVGTGTELSKAIVVGVPLSPPSEYEW